MKQGGVCAIGFTSATNTAFVRDRGVYDEVGSLANLRKQTRRGSCSWVEFPGFSGHPDSARWLSRSAAR